MFSYFSGEPEEEEVEEEQIDPNDYPLHLAILLDDFETLELTLEEISVPEEETHDTILKTLPINKLCPRGWSPLSLCILLGKTDFALKLLEHGAYSKVRHPHTNFHSTHLCILTHNREILKVIIANDMKRIKTRIITQMPKARAELQQGKNFYMEIDWNFTSWIPFTGRFCPNDTFKIWKCGDKGRLDLTLVNFENMEWVRGNVSLIAKPNEETGMIELFIVNHDTKIIIKQEEMTDAHESEINFQTELLLANEIVCPKFNAEEVTFEAVTGWFSSDNTSEVEGLECAEYTLKNINTLFTFCKDHLPEELTEQQFKEERAIFLSEATVAIESMEDEEAMHEALTALAQEISLDFEPIEFPKCDVDTYFSDMDYRLLTNGISSFSKAFDCNLGLSKDFPLSVKEDVLPIMKCFVKSGNELLQKFNQFLEVDMPNMGFPVKMEIPIYKVVKASAVFKNCEIGVDEDVFSLPEDYEMKTKKHGAN